MDRVLQQILEKHQVYLNDNTIPTTVTTWDVGKTHDSGSEGLNGAVKVQLPPATLHLPESQALDFDTYFDDFWQNTIQADLNPELAAWDSLFSALDSRPI